MGVLRFLLWGTEIQPEAHSWRALGTGLPPPPPGEVPQGRGESWGWRPGGPWAFGAHHTGALRPRLGQKERWTGLTAPLGDATWGGRGRAQALFLTVDLSPRDGTFPLPHSLL